MKKIPYAPRPVVLGNNNFWYQWCCDCDLRHVFFIRILRGETPEKDVVELYIDRDDYATDAMEEIKRLKERIKKLLGTV